MGYVYSYGGQVVQTVDLKAVAGVVEQAYSTFLELVAEVADGLAHLLAAGVDLS